MITLLKDYHGDGHLLLSKKITALVFKKKEERFGFNKIAWGKDVLFRHAGSNDGFTCYMAGYVDKQQGFVIMTNGAGGENLIGAVERAVAAEYNWDYMKSEALTRYTGPLANVDQFTGSYEWNGTLLHFTNINNKLLIASKETEGKGVELIPVADSVFLLPDVPLKFTFLKSPDGTFKKVLIVNEHADYSEALKKEFR